MANKKFATLYNTLRDERRGLFTTVNNEESLTQQSDAPDTDINVIMTRYGNTGMLPRVNMEALSGDFTEVGDFSTAQQRILAAQDAFMTVPAEIRAKFNNDMDAFRRFAEDPNNLNELVEMGLAEKKPPTYTPPTPISAHEEEYDDDGNRPRTSDRRQNEIERDAGPHQASRSSPQPLREREELRPNGDRGPGTGSRSR